jgi:hypothetical protein
MGGKRKKKTIRGTSDKTALFSTRAKKQLKKVFSFFEHEVCFMKRLFYTALEESISVASHNC